MATRKNSKTTAAQGVEMILSEVPLKNMGDAAKEVGVTQDKLIDLLIERGVADAVLWEVVPAEYEATLIEIKREQEAFESVRQNTTEPEVAPQLSTQSEPPVMVDEPKPVAKQSKRKSSALTKKKTDAIAKGREASQQTKDGVKQTLARIQAQAGINDAANAGTTYLQAYQATLNQVKGQGLTVLAAEMIRDLNSDSDFNPDDILADLGIAISADTQQALMEQLAPMLGKSQEATQEVLGTAWGNGIDLQVELSQLETLMNFED